MKVLNYLKDKERFLIAFVVRWNAHRKSMWYCPTCNKSLSGEEVTYQETHDIRYNGCGEPVE